MNKGRRILAILAMATSAGVCYLQHNFNRLGRRPDDLDRDSENLPGQNALFKAYPALAAHIPWTSISQLPSPVEELGSVLGLSEGMLWVKRDDLISPFYGGNKVRKLEHLLEDARKGGHKSLITIGVLGSNHCLSTAIHGRKKGFNVHLCLTDQQITGFVRQTLAGFLAAGAKVHHCTDNRNAYNTMRSLFRELKKKGENPYIIFSGGTSGLSDFGHVNAAFEIARQVKTGEIPEPDKLFVAVGTCGTVAGLIAGLKIAGLSTRVVGVRVVNSFPAYPFIIRYFAQRAAKSLRKYDRSLPRVKIRKTDFDLLTGYLGSGYGAVTPEAAEAVKLAADRVSLETTYTGKTLAACLDYCKKAGDNEKVLFWNTYNSAVFEQSTEFSKLPEEIQQKLIKQN